jgi:hypothetical protein
VELRHCWPDGVDNDGRVVTAERIFLLARSMKRARNEMTASSTPVCPMKIWQSTGNVSSVGDSGVLRSDVQQMTRNEESATSWLDHFARVCRRQLVKKID